MKIHKKLVLTMIVWMLTCSSAASAANADARTLMEMTFSCNGSAKPTEVIGWINSLGGGSIVHSKQAQSGQEYTLPNPIHVLGFRATHHSIRSLQGAERSFDVYETIFPNASFHSMANIAGLAPDEAGNYHQRVGQNHLFLREQAGVTYVTCAMGVHASGLERALFSKEELPPK